MFTVSQRLIERVRAILGPDWEENTLVRWGAQLAAGALPGLVLVAMIMRVASQPTHAGRDGNEASMIIPLFSASTLADTAAFHRLTFKSEGIASKAVQFRLSLPGNATSDVGRSSATAGKALPVIVNFASPRTTWTHLSGRVRGDIDAGISASTTWKRIVFHGTGSTHGALRLLDRYQSSVQHVAGGAPYHFVIGNGSGSGAGEVEVSPRWKAGDEAIVRGSDHEDIHICLVGDFQHQAPGKAQLEALDELLDYLSLKLGSLPVSAHDSRTNEASQCMGPKFPLEQVLNAGKQSHSSSSSPRF